MKVSTRAPLVFLAVMFAGASVWPRAAQQADTAASPQTAPLSAKIPVDPQITEGQFPNGLRYYIRRNRAPQDRAELRLVVNAGSILEDDDQRGLAHFVEHMAFSGTTHFPKNDITQFMQSIGMKFGAHVNAYTSFDETVYMLTVPTDNLEALDRAFLIMEDWAQNLTFDPAEIDKVRPVITEEWRLGLGADQRLQDKQFPVLLKGSRYAERIPIGKMDIIQNFKRDTLVKFYKDWYRPDLMGVVAVGDFDKATIEAMITKHFGSIPKAVNPRPRPTYGVPDHPGTLYTEATDKEAENTSVDVESLMPFRDMTTVGAYRRQMVEGLFSGMLSARFDEMSQKPDAPFLEAGAGRGLFVRTEEASSLNAVVKDTGVEQGLDALLTEADRVARFGFTETELSRRKEDLARGMEQMLVEKDKENSAAFAAEFIRNFTTGEPTPGIVYESQMYNRFLPQITLEEVNALAKDWVPDHNRVVVVSGPEKPGVTLPTDAQLAEVMKSASAKDLKPYVDAVATAPLMDVVPTPGTVISTATKDPYGITEWQLSNGVKVVLLPTTYKEDEILVRGVAPGGASLAPDADYVPASTAAQVVQLGGLGKNGAMDLQKMMAGKVADVTPFIGDTDEGVTASGSRQDLETMFQLIYLTFTEPRADPTMYAVQIAQLKTLLANQDASPEFAFSDALRSALSQDSIRTRLMSPPVVNEMNLDKSMAFYKARFADASSFTFTIVGSFDLDTIKPLVERYLGSLPATRKNETWKDSEPHFPTGVVTKEVDKGLEPKSQTTVVFTGPFEYTQTERVAMRAMSEVLENRLRDVLREDLGGTYSITVNANYSKIPRQEYSVAIDFGCDPKRADALIKTLFDQVELLKTNGPTDQQVADVRQSLLRDAENSFKANGYLLTQISLRYEYGEDLDSLFNIADYYAKVNTAMVQDAAKKYLNTANYVRVTLLPEKK